MGPFRLLGESIGKSIMRQTALNPDALHEEVVQTLSSALGAMGWGSISEETFPMPTAVVIEVKGAPQLGPDAFAYAAILGGALGAIVDEEVACVPLSSHNVSDADGTVAQHRLILLNPDTAEKVWNHLSLGHNEESLAGLLRTFGKDL